MQVLFGLACTGAEIIVRTFVSMFADASGPFALIYPAVLISTLYGRWQSGLVTLVSCFVWAVYFLLPPTSSFQLAVASDLPRTVVNLISALVILAFAEIFRLAVSMAMAERDTEIDKQELLFRELEHRTKNNFAITVSLLNMQARHQVSKPVRDALHVAADRIQNFASAHELLYHRRTISDQVAMRDYLQPLTKSLSNGLLSDQIDLKFEADDATLPRDQAVAIGVVLHEVVTNAAKHAFDPDANGLIEVEFRANPKAWRLSVTDNGRGLPVTPKSSGLGSTIIASFARTAGAEIRSDRLERGTRVTLSSSASHGN